MPPLLAFAPVLRHRLAPFWFALGGIFILSVMDVGLKYLGPHYSTLQLTFLRFLSGSMLVIPLYIALFPGWPSRAAIRTNLWRGAIIVFSATSFFYALQTLPLAEAVAFAFLTPLFLALFGVLILKETLSGGTLAGLALGFIGMAVMTFGARSGVPLHLPGALAATFSALAYALALVLLRQRAQQDALMTIILFQNLVPCALLATPAVLHWGPLRAGDWQVFGALAAFGLLGHALMGLAFKRAEASRLAVMEYSGLLFAGVFGYVFFHEKPGLSTLIGSGLILSGTFMAMRRSAERG